MNQKPLTPNRPYLIKHAAQTAQARVREIRARIDVNTLAHQPADELALNEIGVVSVESQRPLFFDPYRRNRTTGAFILIDPITNETLGAGMIQQAHVSAGPAGRVTEAERQTARGHAPLAIALEGGDPEVAWALERRLFDHGYSVHVIHQPGDLAQAVRTALEAGLVAIVPMTKPGIGEILHGAAGGKLVAYLPEPVGADEAARLIWLDLNQNGKLSRSQGPLTGGAGI
jgi:bifunctional enzyme CysN/CysC/sulfate adenylyltransferase subunit 1